MIVANPKNVDLGALAVLKLEEQGLSMKLEPSSDDLPRVVAPRAGRRDACACVPDRDAEPGAGGEAGWHRRRGAPRLPAVQARRSAPRDAAGHRGRLRRRSGRTGTHSSSATYPSLAEMVRDGPGQVPEVGLRASLAAWWSPSSSPRSWCRCRCAARRAGRRTRPTGSRPPSSLEQQAELAEQLMRRAMRSRARRCETRGRPRRSIASACPRSGEVRCRAARRASSRTRAAMAR